MSSAFICISLGHSLRILKWTFLFFINWLHTQPFPFAQLIYLFCNIQIAHKKKYIVQQDQNFLSGLFWKVERAPVIAAHLFSSLYWHKYIRDARRKMPLLCRRKRPIICVFGFTNKIKPPQAHVTIYNLVTCDVICVLKHFCCCFCIAYIVWRDTQLNCTKDSIFLFYLLSL